MALGFAHHKGRRVLQGIARFQQEDGRIGRVRSYIFCPETIREVGAELGLEVRTGLYRFPTPGPGRLWQSQDR